MTLTQLKYLLAFKNEMAMNRAAASCGTSQPNITMQIKRLEKELNANLISRDSYPITLSPLGELVAQQIKNVFKEVDTINDIVKKHQAGKRVTVGRPITDKQLLKAYREQEKEIKRLKKTIQKATDTLITST